MPVDNENTPQRRIIMRRSRTGGFRGAGAGASTRSESLRTRETDAEPDEVDDAIDPDLMNAQVRDRAMRMPAPASQPASHEEDERDNPRNRLNQVALAGSQNYAKEYRLSLLHRLLMRNVPLDQIARQLQVSISTIEKDRAELKKRLREAAKELNIDEMVGNQTALYDEISGMALRVASGDAPTPMKLAAMRTALASNADKTRFYNTAGVFDVLRFRRAEDGSDVSDVQRLMDRTAELLAALDTEEVLPTAPRVRRRRGGFDAMDFSDPDASSSSNETQDL